MFKNKLYVWFALVLVFSLIIPAFASATQLTQAGVRLGRLSPSAATGNDMLVTFKLNTTPTSVAKISISFPSGFTLTAGTPTPATTGFPNTPASIAIPPGTLTSVVTSSGAGLGGTIVVSGLTSASLNNTSLYGFIIPTGSITNPSTGATQYNMTVASQNSGGTPIDTNTTPVYITGASSTADQVAVTASVAPNFSFSLTANADSIAPADPSVAKTSTGVTMLVSTNAPLGYTAYVKSANAALNSVTSGGSIPTGSFNASPDALTPAGTITKYLFVPTSGTVCTTTCSGSIAYDAEYAGLTAGAGGTTGGSFNSTNFSSFMSRSGYTGGDNILLQERIGVQSTVPYASDYTDTLTVVAAGNY